VNNIRQGTIARTKRRMVAREQVIRRIDSYNKWLGEARRKLYSARAKGADDKILAMLTEDRDKWGRQVVAAELELESLNKRIGYTHEQTGR